jgi:hypothetical protein
MIDIVPQEHNWGTWLCSFGKCFSLRQRCWSNPRKKPFSQRTRVAFFFPEKHNHVPKGTQAMFWEHNCSCSREKNFPSEHNHFLGNMVTLSWSTWFMVSWWVQPWSLGKWEQFFWEWLSSLRWRSSKTNIKMIKRFELKISNLERERERIL